MQTLRYAESLRIGVRSIRAHKLRSFLTMLGMIFGVAAVVSMVSIAEGARREAVEQIRLLGTNNIRVNHRELSGAAREAAEQRGSRGLVADDADCWREPLESARGGADPLSRRPCCAATVRRLRVSWPPTTSTPASRTSSPRTVDSSRHST
jgi:hypothetical protein